MGQFFTQLDVKQIQEATPFRKARYKLIAPLIYQSNTLQTVIIVPVGFETDYASVPRIPFIYSILGNLGNKAAVLHDFLYSLPHTPTQAFCEPINKDTADCILRGAVIDGMIQTLEEDMTLSRALKYVGYCLIGYAFWIGVKLGGNKHWEVK